MSKKHEFCFTFYDGNATRDMSHMSRLERGAYMDFIVQQRKRGRLTIEEIQLFLSRDFDEVWGSLKWVLKDEGDGKYYIEWLENSIEEEKAYSLRQSENGKKSMTNRTKSQPESSQNEATLKPESSDPMAKLQPFLYNKGKGVLEGGMGETNSSPDWITKPGEESLNLELPELKIHAVTQLLKITKQTDVSKEQVLALWEVFKQQNFNGENWYASANKVYSYFINWTKYQQISKDLPTVKPSNNLNRLNKGKKIQEKLYGNSESH